MAGALIRAGALAIALATASAPGANDVQAAVLDEISAILRFVEDSAREGELVSGPRDADSGIRDLRARLEAAWDLVAENAVEDACVALESTRRGADGETNPPDLVAGGATRELYARVTAVSAALGCLDEPPPRTQPP